MPPQCDVDRDSSTYFVPFPLAGTRRALCDLASFARAELRRTFRATLLATQPAQSHRVWVLAWPGLGFLALSGDLGYLGRKLVEVAGRLLERSGIPAQDYYKEACSREGLD